MAIAVNGKTREVMEFAIDESEEMIKAAALNNQHVQSFIGSNPIKKVIVVKGKIVNIVC